MKTTFGKIALRNFASCCANLPPDQIRLPGSHCWRDEEGGWMAARTSSGWIPTSWQKLYYYYKKGEGKAERDHQSNITYCAQISITFSRVSSFLCRMDGWVVVSQWKRWCRGLRIFPEQTLHGGSLNTAKEKKSFPPSSHRNPFNSNRRQRSATSVLLLFLIITLLPSAAGLDSRNSINSSDQNIHNDSPTRHSIPIQLTDETNPCAPW